MNKIIIIVIVALLCLTLGYVISFKERKKNKVKESLTTKQMMYIVVLAALATVIGMFEIPIGIIGVKLDFSEVIILCGLLLIGYKDTMIVIILRSAIRIFMPAQTAAEADFLWKILGEIIAILASTTIITTYVITQKVTKQHQKPLIYAVPAHDQKVKLRTFILVPLITAITLTVIMTVFHTLFTMPLYLSGNQHFTIFSLLKDPAYNSNTITTIIWSIIVMFGAVNVVKGIMSPLIFLFMKSRLEKIVN